MPRRLLGLTSAIVFLEGLFFTALGPLLPQLREELALSASQAGLLASGYVAGIVVATFPVAMVTIRSGVGPTTVAGLLFLAAMTFAFGIAQTYPELLATQFLAAVGAAAMWIGAISWLLDAAPSERRGAVIGSVFSVTAAGEIVGPVVGGVAATAGRTVTFASLAGVAVLLAAATLRSAPRRGATEPLGIRTAFSSPGFRTAAWLAVVPCLLLGALLLLGTLKLTELGAGPAEIAAAFVIAAGFGVIQGPLVGHWSDRDGRFRPIRVGLLAGIPVMLALAWTQSRAVVFALLILALITVRFSLGPAVALLFDAGENAGAGRLLPLATTMPVTAAGVAIGSAGGGAVAQAAGSSWAYVAPAAISLVVLAFLSAPRGLHSAGSIVGPGPEGDR